MSPIPAGTQVDPFDLTQGHSKSSDARSATQTIGSIGTSRNDDVDLEIIESRHRHAELVVVSDDEYDQSARAARNLGRTAARTALGDGEGSNPQKDDHFSLEASHVKHPTRKPHLAKTCAPIRFRGTRISSPAKLVRFGPDSTSRLKGSRSGTSSNRGLHHPVTPKAAALEAEPLGDLSMGATSIESKFELPHRSVEKLRRSPGPPNPSSSQVESNFKPPPSALSDNASRNGPAKNGPPVSDLSSRLRSPNKVPLGTENRLAPQSPRPFHTVSEKARHSSHDPANHLHIKLDRPSTGVSNGAIEATASFKTNTGREDRNIEAAFEGPLDYVRQQPDPSHMAFLEDRVRTERPLTYDAGLSGSSDVGRCSEAKESTESSRGLFLNIKNDQSCQENARNSSETSYSDDSQADLRNVPLSSVVVARVLGRYLAEYDEFMDFFTKDLMCRARVYHSCPERSTTTGLDEQPARSEEMPYSNFTHQESPFHDMRALNGQIPKSCLESAIFETFEETVTGAQDIEVCKVSLSKYRDRGTPIPNFTTYVSAKRNLLGENDTHYRLYPEEFERMSKSEQDDLEDSLKFYYADFHPEERQEYITDEEKARQIEPYISNLMEDMGLQIHDMINYLFQEGPLEIDLTPVDSAALKRIRTPHRFLDPEKYLGRWARLVTSSRQSTDRAKALCGFLCGALSHSRGLAMWCVVETTLRNTKFKPMEEEQEYTPHQKYAALGCRICQL